MIKNNILNDFFNKFYCNKKALNDYMSIIPSEFMINSPKCFSCVQFTDFLSTKNEDYYIYKKLVDYLKEKYNIKKRSFRLFLIKPTTNIEYCTDYMTFIKDNDDSEDSFLNKSSICISNIIAEDNFLLGSLTMDAESIYLNIVKFEDENDFRLKQIILEKTI